MSGNSTVPVADLDASSIWGLLFIGNMIGLTLWGVEVVQMYVPKSEVATLLIIKTAIDGSIWYFLQYAAPKFHTWSAYIDLWKHQLFGWSAAVETLHVFPLLSRDRGDHYLLCLQWVRYLSLLVTTRMNHPARLFYVDHALWKRTFYAKITTVSNKRVGVNRIILNLTAGLVLCVTHSCQGLTPITITKDPCVHLINRIFLRTMVLYFPNL